MPDLYTSANATDLAAQAHEWLVEKIQRHQAASQAPFKLALAGGSTPRALYQLLAKSIDQNQIDWGRVQFYWGDERNVPADHADSNYRMAYESMLSLLPIPPENIVGVPVPEGNAADAAAHYEKMLRARLPLNSSGFGEFDCVLLGMGDDVHTASLFPETTALNEKIAWVVANHVAKLNTWRITLTAPLINAAKHVAFLISGSTKTPALQILWLGPVAPQLYPSQMIQPVSGDLTFFVDRPALGEIQLPSSFRIVQ